MFYSSPTLFTLVSIIILAIATDPVITGIFTITIITVILDQESWRNSSLLRQALEVVNFNLSNTLKIKGPWFRDGQLPRGSKYPIIRYLVYG